MKALEVEQLTNIFVTKYYFSILIDDIGKKTVIFRQSRDEPYRILSNHYIMAMAINYQSYYSNMRYDDQVKLRKSVERLVLSL